MSNGQLIGSLVACFLAVGLLAVLTPTVIVNDGDSGSRILRADGSFPGPGPGAPMPGPGRGGLQPGKGQFPFQRMKQCLRRNGGPMPDPMRMQVCMGLPTPR